MKKYKVISSTIPYLSNVEAEFDFNGKTTGDEVTIFGCELEITQTGTIFCFTNRTTSLSLMQLTKT